MKPGKTFCLTLALILALLGPLMGLGRSQEEQASSQVMEQGFDPLATILTTMNIPARATLCGLTGWMASIIMVFSAGMRYADAAQMMEEGCSGPWIITPEMIDEGRAARNAGSGVILRGEKQP